MTSAGANALPPAVVVHHLDQAIAALEAAAALGRPLLLLSPPAAAGSLGPGWFQGLAEAARAAVPNAARPQTAQPGAEALFILDCADDAGHALAALRLGLRWLVFSGRGRAAEALAAIAEAEGARLLKRRPPALDLLDERHPEAACRAWLEAH